MSFKLSAVNLNNLNSITVDTSSLKRSYGRRFTIQLGNDSKEIVMKDLFKRAVKLRKKASSQSELNDVKKFIDRLIVVEGLAIDRYEDQDCFYKFRTFFHRLFGGAFFGSHLERLEKLRNKIESAQENKLEEFRDLVQANPTLFNTFVDEAFEVNVNDQVFSVRGEASDGIILRIQKKEDLGTDTGILILKPDLQKKCYFEFEGNADILPDDYRVLLDKVVKEMDDRKNKQEELAKTMTLIKKVFESNRVIQVIHNEKLYTTSLGKLRDGITDSVVIRQGIHSIAISGLSLEYEGRNPSFLDDVPEVYNALLEICYKAASNYNREVIQVMRESLNVIPEWHLDQLCRRWDLGYDFKVGFISEALEFEAGADYGGVKRDYLSSLVPRLLQSEHMFAKMDGSLMMPRVVRADDEGSIISCSEDEAKIYKNLGQLFKECFKSSSKDFFDTFEEEIITTGRFFSDALFKAVLSLEKEDRDNQCTPEVYNKLATMVLGHLDANKNSQIKNIIGCLDISLDSLGEFLDRDNEVLINAVAIAGEDYSDENFAPDLQVILNDSAKFIEDLRNNIFKSTNLIDELKGVPLGAILDPIYHIATGMIGSKSGKKWNAFRKQDLVAVSNKIQGSIDRKSVAASLQCLSLSRNIQKKAGWLREWILDTASEKEISMFLKFVTGGNSLPEGAKLDINAQAVPKPFLEVCTCKLGISVSDQMKYSDWAKNQWDDSRDAFIRNLKSAIAVDGFQVM